MKLQLRRVLSRVLATALMVEMVGTGVAFAPITAKAATSGGATSHYQFLASADLETNKKALSSNVVIGDKVHDDEKKNALRVYNDGQIYLPNYAQNIVTYNLFGGASTGHVVEDEVVENKDGTTTTKKVMTTEKDHDDPNYHYGVADYRVIEKTKDPLKEDQDSGDSSEKSPKAANENLKLYVDGMPALEYTENLGAVNLSMVYGFQSVRGGNSPLGSGNDNNIAVERLMQVYVTLDSGDRTEYTDSNGKKVIKDENKWLGPVGISSAELLGGGYLSKNSGLPGVFYRIETENLLDIVGIKPGDTIKKIMVMPYGDNLRTIGTIAVSELTVNTYATEEEFKEQVKLDAPGYYDDVDGDTLRAIAVAEAERTAKTPWKTKTDVYTYFGNGAACNYYSKNPGNSSEYVLFYGPTYQTNTDSTRELFQSQIIDVGEDGVGWWNGGTSMSDDKNSVYGMDCQTFVFNAISRVSRSYAWACQNIVNAPYTSLVGDHLEIKADAKGHLYHTDEEVLYVNDLQAVFESYSQARPGDIIDAFGFKLGHTRLVREVHTEYKPAAGGYFKRVGESEEYQWVGEGNGDHNIDPDASYMVCLQQSSYPRFFFEDSNGNPYSAHVKDRDKTSWGTWMRRYSYTLLHCASSRDKTQVSFTDLRSTGYAVFTLDEYKTDLLEKEYVQAAIGSKQYGQNFVEGGVNIAISSNYRLISYLVQLKNVKTGEVLFDSSKYFSTQYGKAEDYYKANYVMQSNTVALTYSHNELDAVLQALTVGEYCIELTVDSGPFTTVDQTKVPQTKKEFYFTVDAAQEFEPEVGDVFFVPGRFDKKDNIRAYLVDTNNSAKRYLVGTKVLLDNADNMLATNSSFVDSTHRGRFWEMMTVNDTDVLKYVRTDSKFSAESYAHSAALHYRYSYHDVISGLYGNTMELANASVTKKTCAYGFTQDYGGCVDRTYECATTLTVAEDLQIIDLRSDVLSGKADAVKKIAQVHELTKQGNAVINTYVPNGTSSGGTATAIIVLDDTLQYHDVAKYDITTPDTILGGTLQIDDAKAIAGEEVTVTAVPGDDYHLAGIQKDGVAVTDEDGVYTFTVRGNHTLAAEFEAHTVEIDAAVAPDCTNTGLTEGKRCSVCNQVLVAQTEVAATGHTEVTVPGYESTTTTTGLTDGVQCSVCKIWLVEQETIPVKAANCTVTVLPSDNGSVTVEKTEYAYGDEVTVTITPDGGYVLEDRSEDEDTTHFISAAIKPDYQLTKLLKNGEDVTNRVKGNKYTFIIEEDTRIQAVFEKKTEEVKIVTENMTLGNSLAMSFYVLRDSIDPAKDYYIQVTKTYADDRDDVVQQYSQNTWQEYEDGFKYYRVTFDGLAAKEMNDEITAQVFYADGTEAGPVYTSSPRIYAEDMLATKEFGSGEWGTLFVDMLNYGASAQQQFNYDTANLANAGLTEEQRAMASGEETLEKLVIVENSGNGNGYFYGSSVSLEHNIALNLYLKNMSEGMYAQVSFTDHYGKEHSRKITFAEMRKSTISGVECYVASVNELAVADCEAAVTVEIYNANDDLVATGVQSAVKYLVDMRADYPNNLIYENALKFIVSAKKKV